MAGRDLSLDAQVHAPWKSLEQGSSLDQKARGLRVLLDLAKRGSVQACMKLGDFLLRSKDDKDRNQGKRYLIRAAELGYPLALVRLQQLDDPFGLKANYLEDPSDLGTKIKPLNELYLSSPYLEDAFRRWTIKQGVYLYVPEILKSYFPKFAEKGDRRSNTARLAAAYTYALDYYTQAHNQLFASMSDATIRNNTAKADGFAGWADKQARQVLGYLFQKRSLHALSSWFAGRETAMLGFFGGLYGGSPIVESTVDHHQDMPKDMSDASADAHTFMNPADLVNLCQNIKLLYAEIEPNDGIGNLAAGVLACFCEERLGLSVERADWFAGSALRGFNMLGGVDAYQSYYDRLMLRRSPASFQLDDRSQWYSGHVSTNSSRKTTWLHLEGLIARRDISNEYTTNYAPNLISGRSENSSGFSNERQIGHFVITSRVGDPLVTAFWQKRYWTDDPSRKSAPEPTLEEFPLAGLERSRAKGWEPKAFPDASIKRLPSNARLEDHQSFLSMCEPNISHVY